MLNDRLFNGKIEKAVKGLWGVKVYTFAPRFFLYRGTVEFLGYLTKNKFQKWKF